MSSNAILGKPWLITPALIWTALWVSAAAASETSGTVQRSQIQATEMKTLIQPAARTADNPAVLNVSDLASGLQLEELSQNSQLNPVANAGETRDILTAQNERVSEETSPVPSAGITLEQQEITGEATEEQAEDPMAQVTSVSQLTDVDPNHWAFQALQSLVERYGCIEGYPDRTYRGNRAMTRYEFAAGLNACLNRVQELIAAATSDVATREDIATLRRLQEEFATELATVRGRVDAVEARTAELEANQFSTTTKLNAIAMINPTAAWAGGDVKAEGILSDTTFLRTAVRNSRTNRPVIQEVDNPEPTLSAITWITLNTSFSGKDLLVTSLATGNGIDPVNLYASAGKFNNMAIPFWDQTSGPNAGRTDVVILESFYQFPITSNLLAVVGPRVNYFRFFDVNRFTSIFRGTGTFNSTDNNLGDNIKRGSGAVLLWNINKQFSLHVGYLAENNEFLPSNLPTNSFNTSSNPFKGLFGGTNSILAELTFSPTPNANIRFYYNHSNIERNPLGQIQPLASLHGVADDGFGGRLRNATADIFGINFDWLVTQNFGLFGRYTYAKTNITPVNPARSDGSITAQAIQAGLAFPDVGTRGALGTISFVIPFDVLSGRKFLAAGGGNGGTQYELEFTYFYPLTRNIAIVPGFYAIFNPNNFDDNPTIFVGNLRTQFSF